MIRTAFALLSLAVLAGIDTRPAAAEIYRPWCVVYSGRDLSHEETLELTLSNLSGGMEFGRAHHEVK